MLTQWSLWGRHPWRDQKYAVVLTGIAEVFEVEEAFLKKLRESNSPFEQRVVEAVYLLRPLLEEESPRTRFLSFQRVLREALQMDEYLKLCKSESRTISLLHKLCRAFFSVPIHQFCSLLVKEVVAAGGIPEVRGTIDGLSGCLNQVYSAVCRAPSTMKTHGIRRELRRLKDGLAWRYDPYAQGNLPHQFYALSYANEAGEEQKVVNIRTGTPTIQRKGRAIPLVTPEFRAFLQGYANQGKRHLYVNLQNRCPKSYSQIFGIENDAARCKVLEELQLEFPDTFITVTLANNSPFYLQSGSYAHDRFNKWELFKREFLRQLFEKEGSGFFFPEVCLKNPSFTEDVKRIMDEIHEDFFQGEHLFPLRERQSFIDLFYVRLKEYLIITYKVSSYNASCRDSIDRGGALNPLFYFYQKGMIGALEDGDLLAEMVAISFAPALLVRQRVIRAMRLERLSRASDVILAAFRRGSPFRERTINGAQVKSVAVEWVEEQTLTPVY
jgi:hypothetical protein